MALRYDPSIHTAPDKPRRIRRMFGAIADRYDRMNRIMTLGLDQRWRRRTLDLLGLPPEARVLDVGTGTGDFLVLRGEAGPGTTVGLDLTLEMMEAGRKKVSPYTPRAAFCGGDALRLPFPDGTFDGIVTGFTLRNVADLEGALREMARVTRPGGRIACLEVARPPWPLLRLGHRLYFRHVVPLLGALLARAPGAYTYLPRSAERFPEPPELARIFERAGWRRVRWVLLTLGTVAIHVGERAG